MTKKIKKTETVRKEGRKKEEVRVCGREDGKSRRKEGQELNK